MILAGLDDQINTMDIAVHEIDLGRFPCSLQWNSRAVGEGEQWNQIMVDLTLPTSMD
jgi:hypothetical protein